MEVKYNVTGARRKEMVSVVSAALGGWTPKYMLMPSCSYQVGDFEITKDGTLIFSGRTDTAMVENVLEGTRYHHERYDGRGYPDGLKGDEIPLFSRIIGVADAFDAMTSNRVYRNHMDTDYVMNEMARGRGTQFDPDALDAFMRLVQKGVINLDDLYARRRDEIQNADHKAEAERANRAEEDKRIQTASMNATKEGVPADKEGA